jgi:hypothetical protein
MTTDAPHMAPEGKRTGLNPWVLGCVGLPVVLMVLCGIGGLLGWRQLVSYGIATDFTDYQEQVRAMDLAPEAKKPLLERMEKMRDKARSGSISFWRWVDYDESIKSMLRDGRLDPDEVEALNRELDRLEAEFR